MKVVYRVSGVFPLFFYSNDVRHFFIAHKPTKVNELSLFSFTKTGNSGYFWTGGLRPQMNGTYRISEKKTVFPIPPNKTAQGMKLWTKSHTAVCKYF